MKNLKIVYYFLLGGIIGFAINFTWSYQQNLVTFSVAFILYLCAGFICSKNDISIKSYKIPLLFWYIVALLAYASIVNYSWDLPYLILICLFSFILGFYSHKKWTNRSIGKYILILSFISFSIWVYFAVPWITYENKVSSEKTNIKVEYILNDIIKPDSTISNTDLKGKVILLDFWYRRCGVCIRQYPKMEGIYNHFKGNKNVAIYFVNNGIDDELTIVDFVKERNIKIPVLLDKNSLLIKKLGLDGFPAFVLINKKGIIKEMHLGYSRDEASVFEEITIKKIEDLLKE